MKSIRGEVYDVLMLDGQQLNWLLDGYDLAVMRPHRSLAYRTVL
jgi:transposase